MIKELIQLKKPIPVCFEEQINDQFKLAKKLLTQQKQFRNEEPDLYRFLSQDVFRTISMRDQLLIKWVFLATTELWIYALGSRFDSNTEWDDSEVEVRIDSEIDDLFAIKSDCLLEEGLYYYDLTATEVNLLKEEIIKGDHRFFSIRTDIQKQLDNEQDVKSYWNRSGLIGSYLELGRIGEAIELLETVDFENDLDQEQMADFMLLYGRMIKITTLGGLAFTADNLSDANIIRLLNYLEKKQDIFEGSIEPETLKVWLAWMKLIECLIGWYDHREKNSQAEANLKNRHDQVLVALITVFENPVKLLSMYSCYSLPEQLWLEHNLLVQTIPDKLDFFRFRSCFFGKRALWEKFEPNHWEFRDQVREQLLSEFPEAAKEIEITYLSVLWDQEMTSSEEEAASALKTIRAFETWFEAIRKNGLNQKLDDQDTRILRWLLKSWIILGKEQPIQEMMLVLFHNPDFYHQWLEDVLGILFSRNCYDLLIEVGENILKSAENKAHLRPEQIEACEKWLIAMAWAYVFQKKEDRIEELCNIYKTAGKRLMIDDECIEEIKEIKRGESFFYYEDPDAMDYY
ncbi:hypothetical protein LNN31_12545 [Acetobacterium wieringae]|uniref:DUF1186 domain-containing protein n=1 Tax=Acetobacterium wieringae TaxID=52694 RepID=A0ABY6HAS3_9FIRM|nr:hypothetical protein [Acetobacterium wieringae]UYO61610.1 hypothetical protein LNN31_12545 [Acetobacterium wieringae]